MARKYYFPDPNDRSANAPSVIVSKPQVIGLWNQAHPDDKLVNVTERVTTWFEEESKKNKWDTAHFAGNECLLVAHIPKRELPE
jgi:hypothetical protein